MGSDVLHCSTRLFIRLQKKAAYEVKATSDHVRMVVEYDTFGSHGLSLDVTYAWGLGQGGVIMTATPCALSMLRKRQRRLGSLLLLRIALRGHTSFARGRTL